MAARGQHNFDRLSYKENVGATSLEILPMAKFFMPKHGKFENWYIYVESDCPQNTAVEQT